MRVSLCIPLFWFDAGASGHESDNSTDVGFLSPNQTTPRMSAFCRQYDIGIQLKASLTEGIGVMSPDCIFRRYQRFDTKYVPTIQFDGLPVCLGLEEFVGPYDYIGAPFPEHISDFDWVLYSRFGVGNGGFSLRSKAICEEASRLYARWFHYFPGTMLFLTCGDHFYTRSVRILCNSLHTRFRFAPVDIAGHFSACNGDRYFNSREVSLGFHGQQGFNRLVYHFGFLLRELMGTLSQEAFHG